MRRVTGFFWALYELARLGVITRFRFRGPYWRWRMETAFGRGAPASKLELIRGVLRYGRWMHEMRSGR
jgi:hypothetical protein